MIIDFGADSVSDGVYTFPDFPFGGGVPTTEDDEICFVLQGTGCPCACAGDEDDVPSNALLDGLGNELLDGSGNYLLGA